LPSLPPVVLLMQVNAERPQMLALQRGIRLAVQND
jgi:hypothetical protein